MAGKLTEDGYASDYSPDFPDSPMVQVGSPWSDPQEWDNVQLGPFTLPGVASVSCVRPVVLDVVAAPAVAYAPIRVLRYAPADVEITLTLWTDRQWAQYVGIMQQLMPPAESLSPSPSSSQNVNPYQLASKLAHAIWHPITQAKGVWRVVIESEESSHPEQGGEMTCTIKCKEFHAPVPIKTLLIADQGTKNFPGVAPTQRPTGPSANRIVPK